MSPAEQRHRGGAPSRAASVWHRDFEERPRFLATSALAAAASFVALWPYTGVIEPGRWSFTAGVLIVATTLVGGSVRVLLRARPAWVRELTALGAQLVAGVGMVTLVIAGDTAFLGLFPTSTTLTVFQTLTMSAWQEVLHGSAPLAASPGLQAVMAVGFAVVAVLQDQLLAQRGAVLAGLLSAGVGAVPMIITFDDVNVVWFVMLGVLMLVLLRYTARRHPSAPRRASVPLAAGVGVVALATTVIVAPALPVSAALTGTGVGVTVDASLRLGDDLRQPNPVEVLTVATEEDVAPYLRLATLSRFDGRVWHPDEGELIPYADGFGAPEWSPEVAVEEVSTSVRVVRMSSSWLPVPYPATAVHGLNRAWRVMPDNRTLVSRSADAAGNDYTVASTRVLPTLEQIRAVEAAPPVSAEELELQPIIDELAREVTADETTDYDRLVALQTWFRSSFSYSLETPVEEGFDGTGAEAVARFLDVRSGYCVHFAGAFALMADSLGMQARIVVGYLPGSLTEEKRGEDSVFSVTSDQLHSWPEVLFPGIGWVPFEPTASLGVPTAFRSAATTGGGTNGPVAPAPTATPGAQETPGAGMDRRETTDDAGTSAGQRRLDPAPVLLTVLAVVLILVLPASARRVERAVRMGRARQGDAGAAWAELRDTMIDLQLTVSDADTPRMRGAALVSERGVPAVSMRRLTDAVERTSYARSAGDAEDLATALHDVIGGLRRSVDRVTRVRALLLPRSLFAGRGADAPVLV